MSEAGRQQTERASDASQGNTIAGTPATVTDRIQESRVSAIRRADVEKPEIGSTADKIFEVTKRRDRRFA